MSYPLNERQKSLSYCLCSSHYHRLNIAFDYNISVCVCQTTSVINNTVIGLVIGTDTFVTCLEPWCILMKVRQYTTTASSVCRLTIVLAATAIGSVGGDSGRLVDTAATILVLVAMLPPFACAGEPFKTKLVFSDFHTDIYMVRPAGHDPTTNEL